MSWESQGIAFLAASVFRPFALVAAAWVMLRMLRVRHPASRHAVWMGVLVGMLVLPFVSVFAPHWMAPVLPSNSVPVAATVARETGDFVVSAPVHFSAVRPALPSLRSMVIWVYLAGLFATMAYRAAGWVLLWRVIARSRRLKSRLLRESDEIVTPVAIGVLRPVVILPGDWRHWDANMRRRVFAHEFAHLRRRDALVSAMAWWVRCVFWFHPLAWWVSRKVSELAELACDAAALEKLGDPAGYSRMLLVFADAVRRAGWRVALPGLAMAAGSGMERRIGLVFELSDGKMRKLVRPGVLLMLGVPVVCLTATVGVGKIAPAVPARAQAMAPRVVAQLSAPPPAVVPSTVRSTITSSAIFETPSGTPSFEVASIKACSTGEPSYGRRADAGWLKLNCQTVADLVRRAYANGQRIATWDGPAWIDSERYTIQAKADGTPERATVMGPMLQALLEDRFQLKVHYETREVPVYALTVASGGLRMQPFKEGSCVPVDFTQAMTPGLNYCLNRGMTRGSMVAVDVQGMSIDTFRGLYLRGLNRPVIDKTGLTGRFDFRLVYAQAFASSEDGASGPSIIEAMQEQLGLKLEPDHGPVEVLVVDRVEKPSGN